MIFVLLTLALEAFSPALAFAPARVGIGAGRKWLGRCRCRLRET